MNAIHARSQLRYWPTSGRPFILAHGPGSWRDSVHTAPIARHDVLAAFDADSRTEHVAKQIEFRRTEALAHARRRADGAVVLDEQKPVAVAAHLGHVAFLGPLLRQRAQLGGQRR